MSLEEEFWQGLLEIADRKKTSAQKMIESIDLQRTNVNLSSAIRVFVFNYLRAPNVSLGNDMIVLEPTAGPALAK